MQIVGLIQVQIFWQLFSPAHKIFNSYRFPKLMSYFYASPTPWRHWWKMTYEMNIESFCSFKFDGAAVDRAQQLLLRLVAQQVALQVVTLVEPEIKIPPKKDF